MFSSSDGSLKKGRTERNERLPAIVEGEAQGVQPERKAEAVHRQDQVRDPEQGRARGHEPGL